MSETNIQGQDDEISHKRYYRDNKKRKLYFLYLKCPIMIEVSF